MEELQIDALGRLQTPPDYRQDWDAYVEMDDEATPAPEETEDDE